MPFDIVDLLLSKVMAVAKDPSYSVFDILAAGAADPGSIAVSAIVSGKAK